MVIFKKADLLSVFIAQQKIAGKTTGFVPTMGALHNGHLTLIEASLEADDLTVASIFVNPTQFNNPEDFKHYPITIEKDIELLLASGCDALFLPPSEEIYPAGHKAKHYELGDIENRLEGLYRPGHFQGVCQVVDRLLDIVRPHHLYLGQKDFQQCMVVNSMLQLTGKDQRVRLTVVPTQRENDGLAMSSRNLRLSDTQRSLAPAIYRELSSIKDNFTGASFHQLKETAHAHLVEQGFSVDYVEIANQHDLSPASDHSRPLVALAAASIGAIRLIDNILLE